LPNLVAPPSKNYVTTNISPNNSAVVPPVWLVGAPHHHWRQSSYLRGTRETINTPPPAASVINPSQVVSIVSAHTVTLVVVANQQADASSVVNSDSDTISPTARFIVVSSSDVPMLADMKPLSPSSEPNEMVKVTMTSKPIEPSVTKITSESLIELIERMMSSYTLQMTTIPSPEEPIEPILLLHHRPAESPKH
jgi:hypothetical protein